MPKTGPSPTSRGTLGACEEEADDVDAALVAEVVLPAVVRVELPVAVTVDSEPVVAAPARSKAAAELDNDLVAVVDDETASSDDEVRIKISPESLTAAAVAEAETEDAPADTVDAVDEAELPPQSPIGANVITATLHPGMLKLVPLPRHLPFTPNDSGTTLSGSLGVFAAYCPPLTTVALVIP